MTDDMGFDLKLPAVGELTFPQWQDWLARYNAVLTERDNRIEKLEAALTHIYAWYPVSIFNPHQTIKEIKEFACKAL